MFSLTNIGSKTMEKLPLERIFGESMSLNKMVNG